MKRVLITGAAGTLGLMTIKYLLSEGKYDITALDLKNKGVYKRLRKYSKRIDVVYGDVSDRNVIEKIIKNMDIVIHLASCLPPVCNYYNDIPKIIEFDGTENILRAINYYNSDCYLIYGSSTSIYGNKEYASIKDKISVSSLDSFSKYKLAAEEKINKSIKKYTILRFPLIMGDFKVDNFIYNICNDENVEVITKEDAAQAIVSTIDNFSKTNKKIYNISGGEECRTSFGNLKNHILKTHGISNKFICGSYLVEKNFHSPYIKDSQNSNKLLNYQNDTLKTYFKRQAFRSRKRKIRKFIGKIFKNKASS